MVKDSNNKNHTCSDEKPVDIFQNDEVVCEKENDEVRSLKDQLNEWKDKYLRTLADCENEKRRMEIDTNNLLDYKISKLVRDIIPLADNIALAISSLVGHVDENVLLGLNSISKQFSESLEKNGIERIKTVGETLNPSLHLVVMKESEGNIVVKELQSGWKLGNKVIREAMVATGKKE